MESKNFDLRNNENNSSVPPVPGQDLLNFVIKTSESLRLVIQKAKNPVQRLKKRKLNCKYKSIDQNCLKVRMFVQNIQKYLCISLLK